MNKSDPYKYFTLLMAACFCSCSVSEYKCGRQQHKLSKQFSFYDPNDLYGYKKNSEKDMLTNIWNKESNRCALVRIINDKNVNLKIRYTAAEVLLEKQDSISIDREKQTLAGIYAQAIDGNTFETLNQFGMLTADNISYSGNHLIRIGEAAIPALAKILDSETRMEYLGGKEADVGNSWHYRAKDVAAFFIFRIRKQKFDWPESPVERDKIIARLKEDLKNEQK